ncbi:leucine-rich repeat domain-containing protein [Acholeplasma laidlawii]|uniref:Leucine-rich repeat domain-containing protein n=2 Tax=Acholeplasma laidlawii TaxID=2148 RepID=A0A553IGF9_ACHLA|nr:leucine-rich repeat domain-containing protein [Acholeplasma laidlawii]ABX81928.1 hypothetical surface-anchored protein [Acholeplasma laidlawii PG-8A]NWH10910.1 leucine-rich repeat domain-containing protein [Acholeplasma laidlawii]NWH12296.1 leucine-rich repeat domain-containing protein [Acholeplasma laidlawii]NWH13682.1 leucine-rich repeat domain-containing protein [Acholeplasma laidlawii]NWH15073.1 leucine-rich repeat domain-containing protein [Acholeplasma laidlawii]
MKHIQLIFLSIVSLSLLFGCTTTISKLEIDNQSILDLFWDNYLIDSTVQNVEASEMIKDIHIFGHAYYLKDIGDEQTRYYNGDEATKYVLHAIITFKGASKVPQHYTYRWHEYIFNEHAKFAENSNLELIQGEIDFNEYTKYALLANRNAIDELETNLRHQMTDSSVLDIETYDKKYTYQNIKHLLSNGTKAILKDNIIYLVKSQKVILAKYIGQANRAKVVIQKTIDDKPVTEIYKYAFHFANIDLLTIPNTIESIGKSSFFSASINHIVFEANSMLKVIEASAFYGSTFYSITIPLSVHTIGPNAFYVTRLNRIQAEVLEKPDGWHDDWVNPDNRVIWGYTPES